MENNNNAQLLYGLYGSYIQYSKAIGYCKKHRCYLTVATLKGHECLRKQCNALEKRLENSYWAEREARKAIKKERKANRRLYI